ncbi:MAG: phage major capsid protein [Gammaproteobacteria bacterium]
MPRISHPEQIGAHLHRAGEADPHGIQVFSRDASTRSTASMKAFSNDAKGRESAYRAGKWLQAALLMDGDAIRWCRDAGMDIEDSIRAAHSGADYSRGGVLVPSELAMSIIRLREEYGVFRMRSRVIPMSTDTLTIPRRSGGLTAFCVGEGGEGTESDSTWNDITLTSRKLMVLSRMSSELAEDAIISIADMLADETAYAFALAEDSAGILGDSSSLFGGVRGIVYRFENETLAGAIDATSGHDELADVDLSALLLLVGQLYSDARRAVGGGIGLVAGDAGHDPGGVPSYGVSRLNRYRVQSHR